MVTRRGFLKLGAAAGAGLYLTTRFGGKLQRVFAQVPGPTLDLATVTKYATPLLIPPVMPAAGKITQRGGKNVDYYEISMKQITQQILPAGLPATTVWGYGAVTGAGKNPLLIHNAPSLTIEAKSGTPVRVKWINDLKDATGNYLPHLLPVDPTLHWANPPGGATGRDTRPTFASTPGPYTGPLPITSRPAMRLRVPGTTSLRVRLRLRTASPGGLASPPSSIRTPTAPRPSGTTTTRWA